MGERGLSEMNVLLHRGVYDELVAVTLVSAILMLHMQDSSNSESLIADPQ
jgi:hypothetical protein